MVILSIVRYSKLFVKLLRLLFFFHIWLSMYVSFINQMFLTIIWQLNDINPNKRNYNEAKVHRIFLLTIY